MQGLWFLLFARCVLLIDIHMKFREDMLKGFQFLERTFFCDGQSSKESTVKILKFGTPQTIAIIVLKLVKFDVTLH